MGALSWAFAKSAHAYFESAHALGQEGRILISGVPREFLERVLSEWMAMGGGSPISGRPVRVALAADWGRHAQVPALPPDVQVTPGFLVAERQGSLLILSDPEVYAQVAESIRGSGGTVREIWTNGFPFKDCEIAGLTWGEVVSNYLARLGVPAAASEAFQGRIQRIRDDLKGLPDRIQRLYECLDSFVPIPGSRDVVGDFDFHGGFLMAGPLVTLGHSDESVLEKFWRELQSSGARKTVDRLKSELPRTSFGGIPAQRALAGSALDFVGERYIAAGGNEKSTPRSFLRTVFAGSRTEWSHLPLDLIAQLYDAPSTVAQVPRVGVEAIQLLAPAPGALITGFGPSGVPNLRLLLRDPSAPTSLEVTPALNPAAKALRSGLSPPLWEVIGHITTGRTDSQSVLGAGPRISLPVHAVPPGFSGEHEVRITGGPPVDPTSAASRKVAIQELCDKLPFCLVVHGAEYTDENYDPSAHSISLSLQLRAAGMYLLRFFILGDVTAPRVVGGPNARIQPPSYPVPSTNLVELPIEADLVDQDQMILGWEDAVGHTWLMTIEVSIEGAAATRFPSTTELIVTELAKTSTSQVAAALANLGATPPRLLADGFLPVAPAPANRLGHLEKDVLQQEDGWRPILAPFYEPLLPRNLDNTSAPLRVASGLRLASAANRWRNVVGRPPSGGMPFELQAYEAARERILRALESQLESGRRRALPTGTTNLIRESLIGQVDPDLIDGYLESYLALLRSGSTPPELDDFLIPRRCPDTILLFDKDGREPSAALLGPFHPLNLARLYLVQRLFLERIEQGWDSVLGRLVLDQTLPAWGSLPGMGLQPRGALALATGDPHWALLVPSAGEGSTQVLPTTEQLVWLTGLGIDPVVGPLGLDPRALEETIEAFLKAFPATRSMIVRLLDESHPRVTEEHLLGLLFDTEDDKATRVGQQLPGGLSVQDARGLGPVDADYTGKPALYWFRGDTDGIADVAALAKLASPGLVGAGGGTAAISEEAPFVAKAITRSYPRDQTFRSYVGIGPRDGAAVGVPAKLLAALSSFETSPDLALEWNLQLSEGAARWQVCSASLADPRSFVDFAAANPGLTLWSYRLFNARLGRITRSTDLGHQTPLHGHFILAQVAPVLVGAIKTLLDVFFPFARSTPNEVLRELGLAGLALGDDFIRSGRHAEGAMGLYLCQRLIWQAPGPTSPLPHFLTNPEGTPIAAGFLLQLDPFHETLRAVARPPPEGVHSDDDGPGSLGRSSTSGREDSDGTHADLMSFFLTFCPGFGGEELWIKPAAIESKFRGNVASRAWAEERLVQARASAADLDRLLEACTRKLGVPERVLLAELVHLGLRLSAGAFYDACPGRETDWSRFEKRVLDAILAGRVHRVPANALVMVHHSGASNSGAAAIPPDSVFMVGFSDWGPTLAGSSTPAIDAVRDSLKGILRHICTGAPPPAPPQPVPSMQAASPSMPADPDEVRPPDEGLPIPAEVPQALADAHAQVDRTFADFVGNAGAVDRLRYDLVDALTRRPPHLPSSYLLTGNPSTGKTMLANKIALCLDVPFIHLDGRSASTREAIIDAVDNVMRARETVPEPLPEQPQGIPEFEYPALLLFIDEVHLVPRRAQEGLLTLTEPDERSVRLSNRICRFPKATFVAATTRPHDVDAALKTRFSPEVHLDEYTENEVAKMIELRFPEIPLEVRLMLARLGQNAPRIALRLSRDLETRRRVSLDRSKTWESHLDDLRRSEHMDAAGLTRTHYSVLAALETRRGGMGLDQLLPLLKEVDKQRIEEEILPGLQRLGLIEVGRGGRAITQAGREYFAKHPAP